MFVWAGHPLTKMLQNCVLGQVLALRAHYVHTAHAEAGILTQEYPSPV